MNRWKEYNRKAYDKVGGLYDLSRPLILYKFLASSFRNHMKECRTRGLKILDLGCGTGNSTYFLDNIFRKSKILGVDASKNMLDAASKKSYANNVSFKEGFIEEIQGDGKYDVVQFFHVLHHFKDIGIPLKKAFTLLKPQGIVMIVGTYTGNPIVRFLERMYKRHLGQGKYTIMSKAELFRNLKKCNFDVVSVKSHDLIKNYTLVVARRQARAL